MLMFRDCHDLVLGQTAERYAILNGDHGLIPCS
jgi:hypothetical protein